MDSKSSADYTGFSLVKGGLRYNKALNWLVASFRWEHLNFPVKIVKDGAISHARIKLGVDIFRNIFNIF